MREIKFRAWDKKRQKIMTKPRVDPKNCGNLVYCDMETIAIGLDGELYLIDECGNYEYPAIIGEDYELMQYTGLKDKNGEEIYEGDIVIGRYFFPRNMVVAWDDKLCSFQLHSNLGEVAGSEHFLDLSGENDLGYIYWEVIGNIYENCELLEG